MDTKIFTDIAEKLSQVLPSNFQTARSELQKTFRDILQTQFAKLDLVTREEFDIQTKVLARTREKLEQLEKRLDK